MTEHDDAFDQQALGFATPDKLGANPISLKKLCGGCSTNLWGVVPLTQLVWTRQQYRVASG